MVTSDSPLSVPDVTLAVARTMQSSGQLPASFQLSASNFSPRNVDPILIYPRPDSETAAWTKHRRHYPGIAYRVPIGVAFGSGPLVYELISGPVGATIGEFLVVVGDVLVPNEDYGVLEWPNPTAGTHSFHVRVSFQDGYPAMDVQWTLEVTTAGTVFIDAVNGNDTTGDGSISNPFQTINAWWKNDLTDTTYSEFQVCYRGGTHDIAAENSNTGVSRGNWNLRGVDKPLVHYPHPGEQVIFDMSDTTIVIGLSNGELGGPSGSDMYFGQFIYQGGVQNIDNPRHFAMFGPAESSEVYAAGGGGQRITFDTPHHKDFICDTRSDNNAGCFWTPNPGENNRRHFFYIHRPTFQNVKQGPNAATFPTNWNGYYLSNVQSLLADHVTCIDTEFGKGPISQKAGGEFWCLRFYDSVQAPLQNLSINPSGSYMPGAGGPCELNYAKIGFQNTGTAYVALFVNSNYSTYDETVHAPVYVSRSTLSRAPDDGGAMRIAEEWPVIYDGALVVAEEIYYLGGNPSINGLLNYVYPVNPLDADLNLTGADRTSYLGLYGAEIKAE